MTSTVSKWLIFKVNCNVCWSCWMEIICELKENWFTLNVEGDNLVLKHIPPHVENWFQESLRSMKKLILLHLVRWLIKCLQINNSVSWIFLWVQVQEMSRLTLKPINHVNGKYLFNESFTRMSRIYKNNYIKIYAT